jgi:outer membrane protein assembly factor BamB
MSDSTTVPFPDETSEPAVPVRSGWRRAALVFTALGAAAFAFGWKAVYDESGRMPRDMAVPALMFGPLLAAIGFGVWWCLLGDGGRGRRVLGVVGVVAAGAALMAGCDSTIRPFVAFWGVPLAVGVTALVLAAIPAARWGPAAALVAFAAAAPWLGLRNEGVSGGYELELAARWRPSAMNVAEKQLAGEANVSAPAEPALPTGAAPGEAATNPEGAGGAGVVGPADWPGFRGADRTGEVSASGFRGWDGSKPRERWRTNPVGPAWSSVCAVGAFLYTQEQRGESESVVCYRADTGKVVWARGEAGRHSDMAAGAGPRATPAFADGRVFAVTAEGVVTALRARTGEPLWRVNLEERFQAKKPVFGHSASPLVVGDRVFVNPAAADAPRLVALNAATGETAWQADAKGTDGYSSPHPATLAGVPQVLLFNGTGLFGHDPASGRELWRYDWATKQNEPTSVQPLVLPDGRVVVGGGNVGTGTRCVKVRRAGDGWAVDEVWKTTKFTPKFNDVVRVGDALFGLDGGRLVCLDLSSGNVLWKEGQYGSGQLLLVGDKLLVVSESGQLACVSAKPDEFEELWKFDVAKGKTWNHPAVARGRLYFRNTTEMVAFDLPGWTDKE